MQRSDHIVTVALQTSPDLATSTIRARRAMLATFLGFGSAIGLFAGAVPTVTRFSHIDNQTLGWCFTIFTLAGITAQGVGNRLGRWFSAKEILLALMPATVVAVAAVMLAHSAVSFTVALVFFGIVTGLIDLYMNGEATKLEEIAGKPLMSGLHGGVSLTIAVFAVVSSWLAASFGPLSTIPVAVAVMFVTGLAIFRLLPAAPAALIDSQRNAPVPIEQRQLVRLLGHGLSFGLVTAAETSAVFWAAKLFADQPGALVAIAGAGIAFFSGCQAASRFAGDRLRRTFGDHQMLAGSIVLATAGCLGVGLIEGIAGKALSLAVFGVGVGAIVPIILAAVGREMGEARVKGIGIVAAVSGIPRTVAPWIFGLIAAQSSIAHGFLAAAFGLVFALVVVVALNLRSVRTGQPPLRKPA